MEKPNPFKRIGAPDHKVPEHLKDKVMSSVTTAKSLMEMSSVFTNKYKEAMASLFKTPRKPKTL